MTYSFRMTPVTVDELSARRAEQEPRYSVCTLVTDQAVYRRMLESFARAGFDEPTTEFLFVDNCGRTTHDAFSGLNRFVSLAKGRYVVVCHQDVVLSHDGREALDARIAELDALDPNWALLGNAGATDRGELVLRITDPHGQDTRRGPFPSKVCSLDENFLLLRRDANLAVSRDLEGFHLYGLDLCVLAAMRGYAAYVVDFHLTHLSGGKVGADFEARRARLIDKYRRDLPGGFYQTTCTRLVLSKSGLWSRLFNWAPLLSLRRALRRLGL